MKKFWKKGLAALLSAAMLTAMLPSQALAAASTGVQNPDKLELTDEYIKVTISGENGGFLIDTVAGNKLEKADDNKFLLYPAEEYDTSYTSFRVTRTDGTSEDYIFGREYGFLGLESSDVSLSKEGNALIASWSVKDISITQRLSLLDEAASQHGMVAITYSVKTESEDIQEIKARIMLDTALGYQDYGVYELPGIGGTYEHITTEKLLPNENGQAYNGSLFAVNDPQASTVTAYTVNTTLNGQMVRPYQVGFGHWNNLASTVFEFTPDETLDFTNPYNAEYSTADSAYALWFDLGKPENDQALEMSTYYGVYSNSTVGEKELVAINFPVLPGTMTLNAAQNAYESQLDGGAAGDISLGLSIENISRRNIEDMTVVIKTQNKVQPYKDWYHGEIYPNETDEYKEVVTDYLAGEAAQLNAFFKVDPMPASEYRRFEVLCYEAGRGEELTEEKLLGSREFYLFCPGVLGNVVTFNSMEPQMVYTEGTRNLYISGQNISLLSVPTDYVTYLKPLSGGESVIVPSTNVVVDQEKNTMYLILTQSLTAGAYQVVFDWNESGKEDTTSPMLQFMATDKPEYISPVYGIVTIEKEQDYYESCLSNGSADPAYCVKVYGDEKEYAQKVTDPNNKVLLEFRGNFSLNHDENGNITEARAVSLESVDGKISNTITISNCLDVEAGSVSIVVNDAGTDEQSIDTNIDGKVYTTNSRTKVWDGVCAISSFANGDVSTLLQYDYDGNTTGNIENSVANTNAITLMWPGAASTAQTIAGVVMEFRYCQFGMMALERGSVNDSMDKRRVIAFGAEMSPDFLIPTNFKWNERETSAMEVVQLKLAKSNYTPSQLRSVQERYAADQEAWEAAQGGKLALYVHDVLFGGGFIGFNASLEVGLPSYADGLPGIEGTLNMKVFPMDKKWEMGVSGSADFSMLQMEASLELKSYNGIPIPNKMYFYVGGITPGLNIDGMGIFWIQGLGGGIDNLYDTMFVSSKVPPLTLMLAGQFSLFNLMDANADLALSLRGYEVGLSNVNLMGVNLIEHAGVSTYWYPKLKFNASLEVSILDIINGGGYLVVEENTKDGSIFWEGYVTASVQTPKIPLIGSITIGSADLGVNAARIWGALHVLGMDMGVTYYWGGDVDFAFGKYDAPEATLSASVLADVPVYTDEETGRTLYMRMGTNGVLAAKGRTGGSSAKVSIDSTADRRTHTIHLGSYTGSDDMAMTIRFTADSEEAANRLVFGDGYGSGGMNLTDETGTPYALRWLDIAKNADEQPDANALFVYDEETKQANITISFTEQESYAHEWKLAFEEACDVALYQLKRLPGLEQAEYSYDEAAEKLNFAWKGSMLDKIENLGIYAESESGDLYTLYGAEGNTKVKTITGAESGSLTIEVPGSLPSGSYKLRIVASSETESVNDNQEAVNKDNAGSLFTYINPNQPKDPAIDGIKLGGDYSIDLSLTGKDAYDGYIVSVYEQKMDGSKPVWIETDFVNQWIEQAGEAEKADVLTVGGQYEAAGKTLGLISGKTYRVGISAYKMAADGVNVYRTSEQFSEPILMKKPNPAKLTVTVPGAKELQEQVTAEETSSVYVITGRQMTENTVTGKLEMKVNISSDQPVSGTWYLDDHAASGSWSAKNTTTITLTGREGTEMLSEESGLAEGDHVLTLRGENQNGDGVQYQYRFRVDTTAPRLMLSSPRDGAFFSEQVIVEGITEPGAIVKAITDSGNARTASEQTVTAGTDGSFTLPVDLSSAVSAGILEQKLTISATDTSGNESRDYVMTLTNELIGAADAKVAIWLGTENITGKTLVRGETGSLELRIVSGDKSVIIPADSNIGRQAEWSIKTVAGNASIVNGTLTTDQDVNGILLVTLDKQQAGAVLGGEKSMSEMTYKITLPDADSQIGYAITAETDSSEISGGGSFTFTVDISEGYTAADDFSVMVNGAPLNGTGNSYTISNIHSDKVITVTGVRDMTSPELSIRVKDSIWKNFLNTITFGHFFNETQNVEISASDAGSGLTDEGIQYYISEKPLTESEVKALEASKWIDYTGKFAIKPDAKYVIYAKASDKSGNITYVSSDGLVIRKKASGQLPGQNPAEPSAPTDTSAAVSDADVPGTGDDTNMIWLLLTGISIAGLTILIMLRRRVKRV